MTDDDDPRMQGTGGVSGDTVRDVDREAIDQFWTDVLAEERYSYAGAVKAEAEAASLRERLAEAERDREVMHAALRLAAAERDTLRAALEETLALHTTKDEYVDPEGGSGFYCAECGSTAEECPTEAIARRALGTGTRPYCRRLGVWIDHIRTTDPAHEGCHILDHPYHYRPPSGGTGTQEKEG